MTGNQLLVAAIQRLKAAGIPDPSRDARVLLAHALKQPRERLVLFLAEPMTDEQADRFHGYIEARLGRRPVSHILGYREFFGHRFEVGPQVLDPRPETEILVEAALERPFGNVLDLGLGSGCILLTLLNERTSTSGVGVDVSNEALSIARRNADALGVGHRADLRQSDWWQNVEGRFDLIVSNPPYISDSEMADLEPELVQWEPREALTPGGDGLDAYRKIIGGAAAHAMPGARLLLEIGASQGQAVSALARAAGLENLRIIPDLDGRDRVVYAEFRR
ncbi:peptide chain release factor N(5)-glutamine methyltransferase [Qingshengfaniella alkalisoli]|uniref:Release factor glutamine methyltransferase n=1 Tax=Qingshengfaniella alkalisoli TaxID=2599296 RepID=A0A5B8ITD2_9RHOB|nr:peptide chain release factor N(5)-glutamine methyltransferase [Qingshengfaniella alkalisoli]QDY68703.1 peptide chain release factor N(5)-glutamine methyltransferase [Qingshengfaniella alkalisoli]